MNQSPNSDITRLPMGRAIDRFVDIGKHGVIRGRDEYPTILFDQRGDSSADLTKGQAQAIIKALEYGIADIEAWEEKQRQKPNRRDTLVEEVSSILHQQFCGTLVKEADLFAMHGVIAETIVDQLLGSSNSEAQL